MSPAEQLARFMQRQQYLRTLQRYVGPFVRFEVRNADNDNWSPVGAA